MSRGPVSNQFPAFDAPYRLAICGESPGEQEVARGIPFCGSSGWKLDTLLSSVGVERGACFVGNVCQWRPSATRNDFWLLDWTGSEVQDGIAQLHHDLAAYAPHCVLALGNAALHLFRHGNTAPPRTAAGPYNWPSKISVRRGSLDWSAWAGVKYIASWHPAFVLRSISNEFDLRQDMGKARDEARDGRYVPEEMEVEWGPGQENDDVRM